MFTWILVFVGYLFTWIFVSAGKVIKLGGFQRNLKFKKLVLSFLIFYPKKIIIFLSLVKKTICLGFSCACIIFCSCALLLESAKKIANLQKSNFYRKIQLCSKNVCKKNLSKKWKNYTFWKALDHAI